MRGTKWQTGRVVLNGDADEFTVWVVCSAGGPKCISAVDRDCLQNSAEDAGCAQGSKHEPILN